MMCVGTGVSALVCRRRCVGAGVSAPVCRRRRVPLVAAQNSPMEPPVEDLGELLARAALERHKGNVRIDAFERAHLPDALNTPPRAASRQARR